MEESFKGENKILSTSGKKSFKLKLTFIFFVIVLGVALSYFFFVSTPSNFIPGTVLQIEPGMSLHSISLKLKNDNIIRSTTAFEAFVIMLGGEKQIKFSNYVFENKMTVYEVAKWIVKGERYIAPIVVTIPEGFNLNEIVGAYAPKLKNFDRDNFLLTAKEGYLFPDTYYFLTTDDETSVINSMTKNFDKKINPILSEIKASGKSKEDIIIMASILEKEASGDGDRALISGILWKRISIGMPLQVDAAPITYKSKGLTKSPIGNPGLKAIKAAIYPESSSYLYYIHGKDGNTYYAKTFEEHKKNIAKYLK
ncbi:MAG: endolytic transglycosylase MltG [Patescibacteria group bacterium]